jgi:hypothetical protein
LWTKKEQMTVFVQFFRDRTNLWYAPLPGVLNSDLAAPPEIAKSRHKPVESGAFLCYNLNSMS